MARFAVISNGRVDNIIEAESLELVKLILPEAQIVPQSSNSGIPFVGYRYFEAQGKFEPAQPYPSWTLDEASLTWIAPIVMPDDGKNYIWSESKNKWQTLEELAAEANELITLEEAQEDPNA